MHVTSYAHQKKLRFYSQTAGKTQHFLVRISNLFDSLWWWGRRIGGYTPPPPLLPPPASHVYLHTKDTIWYIISKLSPSTVSTPPSKIIIIRVWSRKLLQLCVSYGTNAVRGNVGIKVFKSEGTFNFPKEIEHKLFLKGYVLHAIAQWRFHINLINWVVKVCILIEWREV